MARAPRRARTPSSSSESSCALPQQQQQEEEAQSPYANSPTVRVNLHLPYDATPARGHRFSTLRVVADPSRPPSHSAPDPSNSSAEGLAGRRNSQDNSKKEKANRERNERALRRRSDRSEAPSPPEESPWRMRRKELRAAKMAARLAAQKKEVKDEDKDAQNDEADGSAIGSSSAFKRRREGRSTADVETGGGPAADQDVVGIDAALRTPAPKRAKRGAGKAETVSVTTAPDRALEGATSESAAANPFDATSDAETVSNASDDGREGDGQAHKAADRRRSLVLLNAATRQESSLETSQFDTKNDHLPGSNCNDTGGEDVGQDNRTIAHRNGHKNKHRDPRPALLGTISTRRFAAFEEEIPHTTTTTTTTASSPRPPPTPLLQLDQSDFREEELDAIAADTTPPIPRANYKFVHEVLDPASLQELSSSSSSSPFASVQNRRPPIYHMFEPTTGRFLVQQKGEEKMMMHKKQVKEKEILYEGRGQRRVSDGAQGLEFGKPPTPRKTKRRSRIVTMPLPLVVKKNYGGDQGDGQQK